MDLYLNYNLYYLNNLYSQQLMISANEDIAHLLSFRQGEVNKIDAAKRYFDNLSLNPSIFFSRMLALLNTPDIPNQQANLILFMIKGVITKNGIDIKHEQILNSLNFFIPKILETANDRIIDLTVQLMRFLNPEILTQTIQQIVKTVFVKSNLGVMKLLNEILQVQNLGGGRILPFEKYNFKKIPIEQPTEQFTKYYSLVLLKISALSPNNKLSVQQVLSLFMHEPQKTLRYIEYFVAPECNFQTLKQLLDYLLVQVFNRQVYKYPEETVCSINNLMNLILQGYGKKIQFPNHTMHPSNFVVQSLHIRMYFSWLIGVFSKYRSEVECEGREEDPIFVTNLFEKLENYSNYNSLNYIILPVVINLKNQIFDSKLNQIHREGGYFILSNFIKSLRNCMVQQDYYSLLSQVKGGQTVGMLTFIYKLFKDKSSRDCQNKLSVFVEIVETLFSPGSKLSFHKIELGIKIFFLDISQFDAEVLTSMVLAICGCSNLTQFQLINILMDHLNQIQIQESFFEIFIDWTSDFNFSNTFIKMIELQLLSVVAKKYEFSLVDFISFWQHIQTFKLQNVHMDVFCRLLTHLIKYYNSKLYQIQGFPQYCQNIFIITCKHFNVMELAMEIINLPAKYFKLLQRFRNMLIDNLDNNNKDLLDILEVFSILYPVTSGSFGDQILDKLTGPQYYRFYWRLRSKSPLRPIDFQIDSMMTLKWILLSLMTKMEKVYYQTDTSREDVNSLVGEFQQLGLRESDNERLRQMINLFLKSQDNKDHWIKEWKNNSTQGVIKRDFINHSKENILKRYEIMFSQHMVQ